MRKLLSNLPLGLRPALALLALLAGLAAIFQLVFQPARANLEDVTAQERRTLEQLDRLQDRRDTLRAGGEDNTEQLFEQVQTIDEFLPGQPDRSTLIRDLPRTAAAVGAEMSSLSATDAPEGHRLDAYTFTVTVTGSATQVERWLETIQGDDRFITVSDVTYVRNERQGEVTFTLDARLDVWFSDTPPLSDDPDAALDTVAPNELDQPPDPDGGERGGDTQPDAPDPDSPLDLLD